MIKDFMYYSFGKIIVICVLCLSFCFGCLIYDSINEFSEHRAAFMRECLKDHKQYECDVLLGQAKIK
jgi:hypothetical protein